MIGISFGGQTEVHITRIFHGMYADTALRQRLHNKISEGVSDQ